METDDVVNYNVDVLFDVLRVWPYDYPLSPRHPDDPGNYEYFMSQMNVSKKTTPYIHAHIIWNARALPFLRRLHSLLQQGQFIGANFDETGVNVMLWSVKANHTLCKYGESCSFYFIRKQYFDTRSKIFSVIKNDKIFGRPIFNQRISRSKKIFLFDCDYK